MDDKIEQLMQLREQKSVVAQNLAAMSPEQQEKAIAEINAEKSKTNVIGATSTFTSQDGKRITVVNGLITEII